MLEKPLQQGIERIIKEFRLTAGFPKKVLEEIEGLPETNSGSDLEGREDFRGEAFVTIDGENARDFDDAVSVKSLPGGGFLLRVSIADVSHYVLPGTAVDREAYRRATSTYFPDRVIPMLPERLSNDLCSLVPHKDRLTFTAEMEFDEEGTRVASRFCRSVIRSAARLTYTIVRKILVDQDAEARSLHAALIPHLELMGDLADRLQAMRRRRGSLDFDLPEPLIEIDMEGGGGDSIVKAERNKAHRLIEEFMIAANEAVAEFITEKGLSSIYRVHGEPDPEKVQDFATLLHNLGYPFRLGRKPQPKAMAAVIEGVRGKPEERLINTVLLRTMSRAIYDTENVGHYGLASECYTHFTSPIRRYPDLLVHRILDRAVGAVLRGRPKGGNHIPTGTASRGLPLRQLATHCSERERVSMKAEWASRDLAAAIFMKKMIGKRFDGIISNVTHFGIFVELSTYFVEGLVLLKNLKDDFYVYQEKSHLLVGKKKKKRYQIGNPISVLVRGVNMEKRWVDFEI